MLPTFSQAPVYERLRVVLPSFGHVEALYGVLLATLFGEEHLRPAPLRHYGSAAVLASARVVCPEALCVLLQLAKGAVGRETSQLGATPAQPEAEEPGAGAGAGLSELLVADVGLLERFGGSGAQATGSEAASALLAALRRGPSSCKPFLVSVCAARTLNAAGQPRVTLSLRQERLRAAHGP